MASPLEVPSTPSRKMAQNTGSISNPSGSMTSRAKTAAPAAEFDFNLAAAKAKVLKTLDEKVPQQFRKFFQSSLYDKLLQTCLLYFVATFQLEWVVKTMEKSRKQHLDGYNPYVVAQRIRELEGEVATLRNELSPIYSSLILKFSSYEKPQQDKMFFETLYETLISVLDEAFLKLNKRQDLEAEVGHLFRSKHFNMYRRKNEPPRSVDTLSVKELYSLKHETTNRALNAKMLGSLFEKPPTCRVTVASVTNSPLITQYIMSPIVARSIFKDPEQRNKMFEVLKSQGVEEHKQDRRDVGNVFRSAAMLKGVDISKLSQELGSMKMSSETQNAMGYISADKAWKTDRIRAPTGVIAPEAAGLPVDENYNYLALLKRYILYGPAMGLTGMVAPGGGGGSMMSSMTARDDRGGSGGTVPATPSGLGGFAAAAGGLVKSGGVLSGAPGAAGSDGGPRASLAGSVMFRALAGGSP